MKAQKRKQLQSNALATRMTGMVKSIRQQSSRKTALYAILVIALVVAGFLGYRYWKNRQIAAAQRWVDFESAQRLNEIQKYHKDTQPGIALRFQIAWQRLSYGGIHSLVGTPVQIFGNQPRSIAIDNLIAAEKMYRELAKEVKDDPVYHPEAMYALAVITETNAFKDRKYLQDAFRAYEKVAKTYPKSAFGKRARLRADKLKDVDSTSYQEIAQTYEAIQQRMGLVYSKK